MVYLDKYTQEVNDWSSTTPVPIMCKIALILIQCMDTIYEKEAMTDQLMLLLCSIFGQIYTRDECLSEHDTCVYYVQNNNNIKSRMKRLHYILIKI